MLILLGLLVVGLVLAALLGIGPFAFGRRADDGVLGGAGPPLAVLVGGGVAVVALLLVGVGVFGARGGSDDEPEDAATTGTTATAPGPRARPSSAPRADVQPEALGPVVRLRSMSEAERETFPRSSEAVDELVPNTVLRVRVGGFDPFAEARARQCVVVGEASCGNAIDVQFDGDGSASFQYLVHDEFAVAARAGRCRADTSRCTLVVEDADGGRRAVVQTVFHDRLPAPGRIRVTPRVGLVDGQRVTVHVANFPPGSRLRAALCAPPHVAGTDRCGKPGPTAPLIVRRDGTGTARLTLRAGPVGTDRVFCGRGSLCGISVVSGTVFARAPVVPLVFAAPAGAEYDASRVGVGLAMAALLLGLALWFVRRTDWSPVGEEAAPEIDEAEYADLDAIVASLPPEEDLDQLLEASR